MSATVFYAGANELATLSNVFKVGAVATDPTSVSLVVTAPDGTSTTYTTAQLTRSAAGSYTKDIPVALAGLWSYVWIGTGAAADVAAGSWRVEEQDTRRLYTSLDLLRDSLDISDNKRDAILSAKLASAARSVDNHCGRRFWLDSATSARMYPLFRRVVQDPDGSERLLIDDVGTAAGLVVEAGLAGDSVSFLPVLDWEPAPDNALAEGAPITAIRRYRLPWRMYRHRLSRIRVTARWGYPVVPEVVSEATLLQATRLYKRRNSPEGVAGSADWGAVRVTRVDPDVEALLRDYVLPGIG